MALTSTKNPRVPWLLTLALLAAPALSRDGCPASTEAWKPFVNAAFDYTVEYPFSTAAKLQSDPSPDLLQKILFPFEQRFESSAAGGRLLVSFQVSVWNNPEKLTSEAWAKRHTDARLVSHAEPCVVALTEGYCLRESSMTSWMVRSFVVRGNRAFELTYTDIYSDNPLLTEATAECWRGVFERMLRSFRLSQGPNLP